MAKAESRNASSAPPKPFPPKTEPQPACPAARAVSPLPCHLQARHRRQAQAVLCVRIVTACPRPHNHNKQKPQQSILRYLRAPRGAFSFNPEWLAGREKSRAERLCCCYPWCCAPLSWLRLQPRALQVSIKVPVRSPFLHSKRAQAELQLSRHTRRPPPPFFPPHSAPSPRLRRPLQWPRRVILG